MKLVEFPVSSIKIPNRMPNAWVLSQLTISKNQYKESQKHKIRNAGLLAGIEEKK
jgi:hypothetical protein